MRKLKGIQVLNGSTGSLYFIVGEKSTYMGGEPRIVSSIEDTDTLGKYRVDFTDGSVFVVIVTSVIEYVK